MKELLDQLQYAGAQNLGGPLEFTLIVLASMLYGIVLRFIYNVYFRTNEPVDGGISRSFALIGPAVTSIFWLIQYSLPMALGLLGALSFVRFRTPVKRAEDIAFLLVSIAISLACAVLKLWVGLIIILLVWLYSFLRNHVLPSLQGLDNAALVTLHSHDDLIATDLLKSILESTGLQSRIVSSSSHDRIQSIVLHVPTADPSVIEEVRKVMKKADGNARFDVFYPDHQLGGY